VKLCTSIGSSILKIRLHRGSLSRGGEGVTRSHGIFWGDYQARIDLLNFYNTHPMAEMALPTEFEPIVGLVEIWSNA
jgi:hypothetical protein